jgi:hypothetical protein
MSAGLAAYGPVKLFLLPRLAIIAARLHADEAHEAGSRRAHVQLALFPRLQSESLRLVPAPGARQPFALAPAALGRWA